MKPLLQKISRKLLGPVYRKKISRRMAEVQVGDILNAISGFMVEYRGELPPLGRTEIFPSLTGENARGIYFLMIRDDQLGPDKEYLDPWGIAYRVTLIGERKIEVCSAGAEQVFDDSDDIKATRDFGN